MANVCREGEIFQEDAEAKARLAGQLSRWQKGEEECVE